MIPNKYEFQVLMYPHVTNGKDYGKTANTPIIDLCKSVAMFLPFEVFMNAKLYFTKH